MEKLHLQLVLCPVESKLTLLTLIFLFYIYLDVYLMKTYLTTPLAYS